MICLKNGRSQHKTFRDSNIFAIRNMLKINVDSCEACSAQGPTTYSIAARSQVGRDTLKQSFSMPGAKVQERGSERGNNKRDGQGPGSRMMASYEKRNGKGIGSPAQTERRKRS